MRRIIFEALARWKDKERRKPLIIQGVRQVGKTWVMKEFGRLHFKNTVYINFDENPAAEQLFIPDLNTARIIRAMEIQYRQKIDAADTLIILDEIQECGRALTALKYFYENAPEYHIMAAGSLLGVAMHSGAGFPVGKADMLTLRPMSYLEFLRGIGEAGLAEAAESLDFPLIQSLEQKFIGLLKTYFFVGGMPEAVLTWAESGSLEDVRTLQRTILRNYQADFSKHIGVADIPKVGIIWASVPGQLAREKKKFIYRELKEGARAREYENALRWLVDSGLVIPVHRISLPHLPLSAYAERDSFKLYLCDTGLLSAMSGLDMRTIVSPGGELFDHFKGALTEQFALQELTALEPETPLYYWTNDKNSAEIDFVFQHEGEALPMEVKASVNLKAKSLVSFINTFDIRHAIRASLRPYQTHDKITEIPLYLLSQFGRMIVF